MKLLDYFERRFGNLAIPNLTLYFIGGQVLTFILMISSPAWEKLFYLQGSLVVKGEWWRMVTMLFTPLSLSPVWAAFTWYLYYLYGTGLEREWGPFRYNVYLVIIYLATLGASFLFPAVPLTNVYIYASVFLAFAYLYPDFTLLMFFFIPVKIKWLAALTWIGLAVNLILGSLSDRILIVLSIANFLLFFGADVWRYMLDRARYTAHKTGTHLDDIKAYMICVACGATEKDHKIFYYCHTCIPDRCYCEDHIRNHDHTSVH